MKIVPVILAAGLSERMGPPKALLEFGSLCCLQLVLKTCGEAGCDTRPIVVLGHAAAEIMPKLPAEAKAVINPNFHAGQTSSLKAGLSALPQETEGFLIYPVDLPLVRSSTIAALLAGTRDIRVPVYGNKRGHPALLRSAIAAEILALSDEEPAHTVIRRDESRVELIAVDDPGCVMRLNTPEDYAAALAAYQRLSGLPNR